MPPWRSRLRWPASNGGSDKGQADQSEDLRLDNDLITGTSATATRIFMEGDAVVKVPLTSLPDPDAVNETFTLTASLAQVRNRGSGDDELTADTAATDVQTFHDRRRRDAGL